MVTKTIEMTQEDPSAYYQMIHDESLVSITITCQILAGSRVLTSNYQHVSFSDCVFYACEFKGVVFKNCQFENCNFKFSHIRDCQFINCIFINCSWQASSSINTIYNNCELDHQLSQLTEVNNNDMSFSFELELPIAC
jgi:uncharacterized protein YjbI with pentapeptide repeats